MNTSRQLAIYLGVGIPASMPNGEYAAPGYTSPNYRPDRDTEDAERAANRANIATRNASLRNMAAACTPGSAVALIAAELEPLYRAPGERDFDGRTGAAKVLERIVEEWPTLPAWASDIAHDLHTALGARIWVEQGKDWEYIDPAPRAIYDAIAAGVPAGDIQRDILTPGSPYAADRRAARNGDEVRR